MKVKTLSAEKKFWFLYVTYKLFSMDAEVLCLLVFRFVQICL